jgi:hypothetical protein
MLNGKDLLQTNCKVFRRFKKKPAERTKAGSWDDGLRFPCLVAGLRQPEKIRDAEIENCGPLVAQRTRREEAKRGENVKIALGRH